MAVYKDLVYGKRVLWWICPFCGKRIVVISSNAVDKFVEDHICRYHKNEDGKAKRSALYDMWLNYVHKKLPDRILTDAVIDKL